ncbi:MAG: AtpZ/AtpI family protein [Flavobacteriales bacterium TMED84]|nr:MAG: AtpZ/AtpI family protein [Flavobacteriales bacterium TMED84]
MGVIIFIGTWLGQKTDDVFEINHVFTISFSLISVFISLYYMYVKTKNES